jgi:hypothetical protein
MRPSNWLPAAVLAAAFRIRGGLSSKRVNIPLALSLKTAGNRGFRRRRPASGRRPAKV